MDRVARSLFGSTKSFRKAMPVLILADMVALCIALLFALYIRFDNAPLAQLAEQYLHAHWVSLLLALGCYIAVFTCFGLYRYAWRFASLEVVWSIICASTAGTIMLIALQVFIDGGAMPRSVLIIFWLMSLLTVGGVRILLRLLSISLREGMPSLRALRLDRQPTRVVILGSEPQGVQILSLLREMTDRHYEIVGFLDNRPETHGIVIRGVRVLGPLAHLTHLLANRTIDEVLVALDDTGGSDIRSYVLACRRARIAVRVIPGLQEMLQGTKPSQLAEISVEDLLRRPPVRIDNAGIGASLTKKRILVTGAGGSIGSELCRQILNQEPELLVLFGHGENSIYQIHQELSARFPSLQDRLRIAIGSVSDDVRIEQVFAAHQPQIVFHAAAHKHVPIVELNVAEAVQNNVMGTQCVAEACARHKVERMVLISTDKAVSPSNVMGATKWLCEQVVQALAQTHPSTTFITVRFGNVLGSRGSVVPLFQEQIRRGGPVTVTHPEMTRFFMTIPEAVQLVLQAGAIGTSGKLYLLDMGKPVRILDLARDMIALCGMDPDKDLPVVFTGLRPGEKLHERLHAEDETLEPAACAGMSVLNRTPRFTPAELRTVLRRLHFLAMDNNTADILATLRELVPGFVPMGIAQPPRERPAYGLGSEIHT